ncbi:hypothetical protein J6590_014100 [Homalodisca vitripennis]|nr:hypothetical protein J6590_014100 [Homalodisca vitripennis]
MAAESRFSFGLSHYTDYTPRFGGVMVITHQSSGSLTHVRATPPGDFSPSANDPSPRKESRHSKVATTEEDGLGEESRHSNVPTAREDGLGEEPRLSKVPTTEEDGLGEESRHSKVATAGEDGLGEKSRGSMVDTAGEDGLGEESRHSEVAKSEARGRGRERSWKSHIVTPRAQIDLLSAISDSHLLLLVCYALMPLDIYYQYTL